MDVISSHLEDHLPPDSPEYVFYSATAEFPRRKLTSGSPRTSNFEQMISICHCGTCGPTEPSTSLHQWARVYLAIRHATIQHLAKLWLYEDFLLEMAVKLTRTLEGQFRGKKTGQVITTTQRMVFWCSKITVSDTSLPTLLGLFCPFF